MQALSERATNYLVGRSAVITGLLLGADWRNTFQQLTSVGVIVQPLAEKTSDARTRQAGKTVVH